MRNVSGEATDLVNMMDVKRQATYFYGASREGDKAEDGTQKGGLATTALACDTDHLSTTDMQVEIAEQLAVAKGERG